MNWKKFWFLLIPLLIIISLGIFASIYEENELKKCSNKSTGLIKDIYEITKRGYFVKYEYIIDGEKYETSEGIRTKNDLMKFSTGDTIQIYFACDSPEFSKYLIKN